MRKDIKYRKVITEVENKLNAARCDLIDYYNPDGYFVYNGFCFIIEHSSTGDRKSHIGELFQAMSLAKKINLKIKFILVLDNQNVNAPKKDREFNRLNYYAEIIDPTSKFIDEIVVKNVDEVMTVYQLQSLIQSKIEQ